MTILEALYAEVDPYTPNRNTAIRALDKVGLTYTADATSDDDTLIATATVDILQKMLVLGSESEGGFSQSYTDGVKARIRQICDQYGLDVTDYITFPSVDNRSYRW